MSGNILPGAKARHGLKRYPSHLKTFHCHVLQRKASKNEADPLLFISANAQGMLQVLQTLWQALEISTRVQTAQPLQLLAVVPTDTPGFMLTAWDSPVLAFPSQGSAPCRQMDLAGGLLPTSPLMWCLQGSEPELLCPSPSIKILSFHPFCPFRKPLFRALSTARGIDPCRGRETCRTCWLHIGW